MAHATDPVGPSAVAQGATPVVATANAPYAIATPETGDTTNVVSASYVKGAYNDAIAAVNKVNADKQAKLLNGSNNHTISSNVVAGSDVRGIVSGVLAYGDENGIYGSAKTDIAQDMGVQNLDDALISANVVLDGFYAVGNAKQNRLNNWESGDMVSEMVISVDDLSGASFTNNYNAFRGNMNMLADSINYELDNTLMSADGVITLVKSAVDEVQGINDSKRVRAVTAWGNDSTTALIQFANAQ